MVWRPFNRSARIPEMKKIGVGQAIQIIRNVGVKAGIVFLSIKLRQKDLCGANCVPVTARRLSRVGSLRMDTAMLSTHDS